MMPMRVIGMLLGIPEIEQISGPRRQRRQPAHQTGRTDEGANADKIADGSIYADYVEWRATIRPTT